MSNKIVLITGATAGIGKASAMLFAENGWDLIITGRRADRLKALSTEWKITYGIDILTQCYDIRKRSVVTRYVDKLKGKWRNIDVLINNAGLAVGKDDFQSAELDDWDNMIDTNVKGLLYISKGIVPLMIERGAGHIINVGSIAGTQVYGKGNIYCATKHAVDAISKAMRIDLLPHKIKVTSINPGLVETEFSVVRYKGNRSKAKKAYQGLDPLVAEDIADVIYFAASRKSHVNINEIMITPTAQADAWHAIRT